MNQEQLNKNLLDACEYGNLLLAEHCIKEGADVDTTSEYGFTPLHLAIRNHHIENAKLLIEHGALLNVKNEAGYTPLHVAAWYVRLDMVEILIEHGAPINEKNEAGLTPLDCAAKGGDRTIYNLIKNKGGK